MFVHKDNILHSLVSILTEASDDAASEEECELMITRTKDFLAKALTETGTTLEELGETPTRIEARYENTRANFKSTSRTLDRDTMYKRWKVT